MWDKIKRVTFELSNRCNYSNSHGNCPLFDAGEPRHLPMMDVVYAIVELGKHDFAGRIAFHNYCEPLLDPRLFFLIYEVEENCPDAEVFIMTNGWNLSQQLLTELYSFGCVREVEVSAYTEDEYKRLTALRPAPMEKYRVVRHTGLDDRRLWYDRNPIDLGPASKCDAPFGEVVVRCTGEIALCCFDWAASVTFGNLEHGLSAFVESARAQKVHRDLMAGSRDIPICKRCGIDRKEGTR